MKHSINIEINRIYILLNLLLAKNPMATYKIINVKKCTFELSFTKYKFTCTSKKYVFLYHFFHQIYQDIFFNVKQFLQQGVQPQQGLCKLTLTWSRGVPMDPKISFRTLAQKWEVVLYRPSMTLSNFRLHFFWWYKKSHRP